MNFIKDMKDRDNKALKYQQEHKNTPYKELVNVDLKRTLTNEELTAVEWWVDVILKKGVGRENLMRSMIISGGINNVLRHYNECLTNPVLEGLLSESFQNGRY